MALLSYLQIFLSMFTCVLLYFVPGIVTYKTMAAIIAVVSTIALILLLTTIKRRVDILFLTFFGYAILIYLYIQTGNNYEIPNERYNSFLLVLAGQIAPSILCAIGVAQLPRVQYRIKQLAPYVGWLFSFISFVAAFFPDSETSGGFVATESGLNYQTTSYLAAYAAGFNLYYVIQYKRIKWLGFFSNRKLVKFSACMLGINLISTLIAGGRGGLLLFIVQSLYGYWIYAKEKNIKLFSLKNIIMIGIISIIALGAINFASSFGGATNGFSRIVNTVENQDENGRDVLRGLALMSFLDSPLTGHGLGSVFYEVGEYSHNCITDALVETGIIGTVIFIGFLFITWRKNTRLFKYDSTNSIWQIIFLDGLVMAFFSGYYLGHLPIYWIIGFSLSFKLPSQSKRNKIITLFPKPTI